MMTADVVIVGGGIVGAACAARLARAGLSIILVEAVSPASGATSAGMGHVVVMDDSEAQFALSNYSQQLWDALADELPAKCEFARCGTIWVAADDEEMAAAEAKHQAYQQRGTEIELLDAAALARHEPNLRDGLAGGLRMPADSVVYPPTVVAHLLAKVTAQRGRLVIGRVTKLHDRGVTLESGEQIAAPQVVLATGHLAAQLLPSAPVRPRKGHLVITDRYPGFVNHQLLELGYLKSAHGSDPESVAFNVQPRITGQLLIGSSRQYGVESNEVEQPLLSKMLTRTLELMPKLGAISVVRAWTGFRAATPDGLPLIGRDTQRRNLLLATGHEGLGITTSLGTAELIAVEILGHEPPIDPAPYRPDRLFAEEAHA